MEGLNQVIQGLFYGPMKSMVFKAKLRLAQIALKYLIGMKVLAKNR